eukprot:3414263-Rhodomonas_salina.1
MSGRGMAYDVVACQAGQSQCVAAVYGGVAAVYGGVDTIHGGVEARTDIAYAVSVSPAQPPPPVQ